MTVCFPAIAICNVEALLAPMPGISDAVTGTRLNDPISEVDVTKYQQAFLAPLQGKTLVNCVGKVMNKRKMEYSFSKQANLACFLLCCDEKRVMYDPF